MDQTMTDRRLVVALGDTVYRVERPFAAPAGPGGVSDVAVGPDGLVHMLVRTDPLLEQPMPAVTSMTAQGAVIARWGEELIIDAHMLNVAADGRVFIVDRDAHEIVICRDGRRIGGIGRRHLPLSPFNHPTDVAFCPRGTIYVSDGYANHRVHRFTPDGEPLESWGALGDAPGEFMNPHAVWVQADGRVIVADRENDRLQVFGPDGAFIEIWTGFVKPLDICADREGRLYVTDMVPSLTLLAPDGHRLGRCRPVLNAAHGIALDTAGATTWPSHRPAASRGWCPLQANAEHHRERGQEDHGGHAGSADQKR